MRLERPSLPGLREYGRPDRPASTIALGSNGHAGVNLMNSDRQWRLLLASALADGVPRRALNVAFVVGTVLNLINQGDAIFGAAPINWFKIILTFLVPYAVFTFGAVSARAKQMKSVGRPTDGL